MKYLLVPVCFAFLIQSCENKNVDSTDHLVGKGRMPNLAKDSEGNFHLVFGTGDSIMYSISGNNGNSFSSPTLLARLPNLAASHMRGPQVAATTEGITVIACNKDGDIFSYSKKQDGSWSSPLKVNDVDTVAKEGLMALGGDGANLFAAWLDLRDKHNKIFGARSTDGGKSWSANIQVYASPDTTVCECCKPSVQVKDKNVYIMFRNWLDGNRDLYLTRSPNGGESFGPAEKLGRQSWALNGCPMDGGALVVNSGGDVETVWNRKGLVYSCQPGKEEIEIGKGKSCTIESMNSSNVFAWVENGEVVILKDQGEKQNLGKGQLPLIKAINDNLVLCVWEKEKEIHSRVVKL
jgi:hypothetical protein